MFKIAQTTALAATVSMFALTTAEAAEQPPIGQIEVSAEFDAAQDSNALQYYPEVVSDLTREIAARVETSNDNGDPTIRVQITRMSLDGDTLLPDSAEFNELEGIVVYSDDNNGVPARTFPIQVAAYSGDRVVPEGFVVIAPDTTDFYNAMLVTFADTVAEKLPNEITSEVTR